MKTEKIFYGTTKSGQDVFAYKLKNSKGMEISCLDYGAIIASILAPDKNGDICDVVLGYDGLSGYEEDESSFGALVGRHANRIANASFTLNGVNYQLEKNDGENNLHSGTVPYRKMMYEAELMEEEHSVTISFSRLSPDMEQGFPGNFNFNVCYTLTDDNEVIIEYTGISDKDTVVNLTNHSYFNMAGHNSGSVLEHKVQILSDQFTPTDEHLIPTGEYRSVDGTPMDFRTMKTIGQDIHADYEPLKQGGGYDHNFVLENNEEEINLCAKYWDEKSGRLMEVYTDMPGMQMYTANFLHVEKQAKENAVYNSRDAVCFETQFYPNSCNIDGFPGGILKAGEEYHYITVYRFAVQ